MSTNNNKKVEVGFIWQITDDVLRDAFKKNEIGDVVLPFVVIRRLDCILDGVNENVRSTYDNIKDKVAAKSMMLALWDHNYKNAMRIDLWTKDMPVDEMKRFFYETLQTMGDSFLRATGEKNIVEDLRDYCAHFADKMEVDLKK